MSKLFLPKINIERKNAKKIFSTILLLIISLLYLSFGLYHLGKAAYVDERLWTYSKQKRIEKYWNNIKEHDWKNTRPSDKPGITLAIISYPSLKFVTPSNFIESRDNKADFMKMLFTMRLPLIILGALSLFLFYYFSSLIFNKKIGLLVTGFIGLSPILVGIGRLINPDALSWIIMPLTFIAT